MQKKCTQKVQPQKPWPRKMRKKCKQKCKTKCNFWIFFVKHAHFQNLHFFRMFFAFVSHFFCILCCFFFAFYLGFLQVLKKLKPCRNPLQKMQFAFVYIFFFVLHACLLFFCIFFALVFCGCIFLHFLIAFFLHFFKFLIF